MGLWKSNGTTSIKVNKRYKSDGSVLKQVKKRYKSDGVTLELLYASEFIIIGANAAYQNGWAINTNNFLNKGGSVGTLSSTSLLNMKSIGSYGNYDGVVNVYSKQKIDLSGYSKMAITFKVHDSDAWGPPPTYGLVLTQDVNNYTFIGGNSAIPTGTTIFSKGVSGNGLGVINTVLAEEIDISKYQGLYYLDFFAHAGLFSSRGKTAQWDVTGLFLS